MTFLNILGYIVDAVIIITYGYVRSRPRWFDWANFLGSPVILTIEALGGVWSVMPLTIFFGGIGGYHLIKDRKR